MSGCGCCDKCNCVAEKKLNQDLRKVWSDHVYWTREFMLAFVMASPNSEVVTERLLENPKDLGKLLSVYYAPRFISEFEPLFTEHLTIAARIVVTVKAGASIEELQVRWKQNAKDIALLMSKANSFWKQIVWENMMLEHLELTTQELTALLQEAYPSSVEVFDKIYIQALDMADMMTHGIIQQQNMLKKVK